MRIGLFTASQWSQEEDPKAVLVNLRQQVRAARQNGFSSLLLGQHVLSGPMGMFQTMPLLGQIADDAAGMQIGPGVLLLSMMNPVLAAEEGATVDWLCDGNYVLAAGLGYREEEFQAMGVSKSNRVGRLTEGLEIIKRLWTEDEVTRILAGVPGVQSVEADESSGELRFIVESDPTQDLRAELARRIIERGWGLVDMHTAGLSLEDVFLQLTARQEDKEGDSASTEPEPA